MGERHPDRNLRSTVRETRGRSRPEPGVLCWNCRRLTPFEEDRCQFCDAAFAGSTGGAFATSRLGDRPVRPPPPRPPLPSRSLADLVADLRKVHDVAGDRPSPSRDEHADSGHLFQCPSCGRFVSEKATVCACGVKFATSATTFTCPECDSVVPALEDSCPVCHVRFEDDLPRLTYACPRCGAQVTEEATRCSCGVWFEA